MQFKHPEILYALLLLVIPIIVHLFQLRRFQKVAFTNVEFLKSVSIQTRKSQQLKKWLTLLTRLLLLAAIIIAFAQPFTSETKGLNMDTETVIYLDNSFSMQAKGDKGELLKRAVQDVINSVDDDEEISIFTNNNTFRKVTTKSIRNDLLQLDYASNQLDYDAVILKGKKLFSKNSKSVKNLVLVSDFQLNGTLSEIKADSLVKLHLVQLEPVNMQNTSIDSIYISKTNSSNIELKVAISQQGTQSDNLPVSLFNDANLISKTAIDNTSSEATFTIPFNSKINGSLTVDDASLNFDNSFHFNINEREKTNVLSINDAEDDYFKHVYSEDEFNFSSVAFNQLNYNSISEQNLIILNEVKSFPVALINALDSFLNNEGYLLIIPSEELDLTSYNQLLTKISTVSFKTANVSEKKVTTINYSHPLFNDVFDKRVTNFQYPKVNSYIDLSSGVSAILQYEDGKPFLFQNNTVFVFTSALNINNSNVINSPLIVPTLYNIGRQSYKIPKLYYSIGNENTFDVNTTLQQDDIVKLKSNAIEIIPQQRTLSSKVVVTTTETPSVAGIYNIIDKSETIANVSYNYNRKESNLTYHKLGAISSASVGDSIPDAIDSIKSATNINALWKWFAIFALIFLIIEMLILKYYR